MCFGSLYFFYCFCLLFQTRSVQITYECTWLQCRIPGANDEAQTEFVEKWIGTHSLDSKTVLGKPLMVTEFGKSSRSTGFSIVARDSYFGTIYNSVYSCARNGGPCGGALFWQVMAEGMENWSDGYEVALERSPSTAAVITQQSARIASVS